MDIQNHYYGHSAVLAAYVGLKHPRHIRGLLQHGWTVRSPILSQFGDFANVGRGNKKVVWSHSARGWDPADGTKGSVAVGAPWFYLDRMTEGTEWASIERRGPVVFPLHGTRLLEIEGDHAAFAKEVADRDGPATVCLHSEDLKSEVVLRAWSDAGHELVCAGERRDPLFLLRIHRLVRSATKVISNRLSTSVMYAAASGVAISMYGPDYALGAPARDPGGRIRAIWPEFYDESTDDLTLGDIARSELGAKDVRPPEELKQLLGWDRRSPDPGFTYWLGGPATKALHVVGLMRRADGAHETEAHLSPVRWLRHPLDHLPSRLPRGLSVPLQIPDLITVEGDGAGSTL